MRATTSFRVSLLAAVFAVCSLAGARIESEVGGMVMGSKMSGTSVTNFDGAKMSVEQDSKGDRVTTIIDADAQRMVIINHNKREAEVFDMSETAGKVRGISSGDVSVNLEPTGEEKEFAGVKAKKHNVNVRVNSSPVEGQDVDVVIQGVAWIAPDAPGIEAYRSFYNAAAEKGLFFVDPKVAKGQAGYAKGMAEIYRTLADAGMAVATELDVKFAGKGLLAGMLTKMGGGAVTSTATKIEETDFGGSNPFDIPHGYRTRNR